ncbi:3-methyl-2-oxobutanoate hydroxymethyltransferase [Rhinocladiella mackenziei CBS 650.93]|uniref:3-methyl-2-oxobutanoate hydroxymethyltransferase n=1 Tax=Rhinocladiella mackenziei CBS 650.93 TaxID=1442369 RepID=A0A0D2J3N1_9EURO|nr:3-methyl-2-oxobutanoate hydroxymethyltransferase [Rhinocladiella mackenziei CBS 650.93]KIX03570.1 3-methyl-2-oxobutanoate hydroxymethyltransferase [Rhinocladiella mackenziei CBS 650.93]
MAAVTKFRAACKAGVASCITAWDYPTAVLAEEAEIDLILIGDSTGIVALGEKNTQSVTVDEIIYHCKAVARGAQSPFLLGDMPFGSYEASPEQAAASAIRIVKEGRVDGVKLEGGAEMAPQVAAIIKAGIPVIGHIGLTPQRALTASLESAEAFGSTAESAKAVLGDALALQKAGAIALVLEAVASPAAEMITKTLDIPTIGIGCGPTTSAQIALQSELLGYRRSLIPKWHKIYADVGDRSVAALKKYREEVLAKTFPSKEHVSGYQFASHS